MAFCPRNYSICCAVISAWGIIQLVIMGVLFYTKAVAFSEDLGIEIEPHSNLTIDEFYEEAATKYNYTVSLIGRFGQLIAGMYTF